MLKSIKFYLNIAGIVLEFAIALAMLGGGAFAGWQARGQYEAIAQDPAVLVKMLLIGHGK